MTTKTTITVTAIKKQAPAVARPSQSRFQFHPTFYEQLISMKVFLADLCVYSLAFCLKENWLKNWCKKLLKLTTAASHRGTTSNHICKRSRWRSSGSRRGWRWCTTIDVSQPSSTYVYVMYKYLIIGTQANHAR